MLMMTNRRRCCILWCVVFPIILSCSRSDLSLYEDRECDEARWIKEAVKSKYQGRKTGTYECDRFSEYLMSELKELNYHPQEQTFSFRDSINMKNIYVIIPGKCDSIIVIGAHYDGAVHSKSHQAANDNASGIVCLLSICKKLSQNDIVPNKTIVLAFWDGEEYTTTTAFNGSHFFVENYPHINMVCSYGNLDTMGRLSDCVFYQVDSTIYTKKVKYIDLMSRIICDSAIIYNINYKNWTNSGSDYVSFRDVGIPFWGWNDINCHEYIHTKKDNLDHLSINKIKDISSWTHEFILHL